MFFCVWFVPSRGHPRPDYLHLPGRPARADSWAVVIQVNRSTRFYYGGWACPKEAARYADAARHYLISQEMLDARWVTFNFPDAPYDESLIGSHLTDFVAKNRVSI